MLDTIEALFGDGGDGTSAPIEDCGRIGMKCIDAKDKHSAPRVAN